MYINTSDSLYLTLDSFASKPSNMGTHAKADNVNIIHALRRVISQHQYQFRYIVSDFLALKSGHKIQRSK